MQKVREAAARVKCQNNLKQLGLAFHNFESARRRVPLPPRRSGWSAPGRSIADFWGVQILPYIEQDNVRNRYNFDLRYNDAGNRDVIALPIATMLCPSAPNPTRTGRVNQTNPSGVRNPSAVSDYAGTYGPDSMLYTTRANGNPGRGFIPAAAPANGDSIIGPKDNEFVKVSAVTDGTSNSIALVESAGRPEVWRIGKQDATVTPDTSPTRSNCGWATPNMFVVNGFLPETGLEATGGGGPCMVNCSNVNGIYAFHAGVANVCLADGSVRSVRQSLSAQVVAALLTREGGEVIPGDY